MPTVMFRFVPCASDGEFWSWEQPFCRSSAAVVTWQQYTKFRVSKPVKISSEDSLRQAALPWCADVGVQVGGPCSPVGVGKHLPC